MLKVSTVNVNGIRAAYRRGMADWLVAADPQILLLQEVRASDEIITEHLGPDWHLIHRAGAAKGRNGVAVASRHPITAVRSGLGPPETETEDQVGRWVEADLDVPGPGRITVASAYVHSGTAGTASMDDKYAFLDKVTARLGELITGGRDVVVGGDVNIAHREVDIKNWRGNLKSAGFLPAERAYLDAWLQQGWVDLGRRHGGDGPGPFTWWSWRGQAYNNDAGWRIDYQYATPDLAESVTSVRVDRAPSYAERFSDHAPLTVTYGR
ncbi:exodeoxyribonuclease III [Pseudactinotalea sp. Z1748]|uniref:exodeoxyribonuclease III n=1 Tax=Pseudactinotalea sp. Z1748 TaxID=3413027 RepID=UPI003C7C24A3